MREKRDTRIFFALWPDVQVRRGLHEIAQRMPLPRPARAVPAYNLHLTLHFIGNVFFDELDCLRRAARGVAVETFEISIDNQGWFSRPRVGWLGCSTLPEGLRELHAILGSSLEVCGYRPEKRRYSPHVTVARKLKSAPRLAPFEPLRWKVDNFVLIESRAVDGGVRYEVTETYRLT